MLGGDIITTHPGGKRRAKIRCKDIGKAEGRSSPWLAGAIKQCRFPYYIEHVKKKVPPMIFFPDHDDSGMQRKCRQHIESLLDNDQVSTACICMKQLETALGIGNQFLSVVTYAVKLIHSIMSQLQKWLFKKIILECNRSL